MSGVRSLPVLAFVVVGFAMPSGGKEVGRMTKCEGTKVPSGGGGLAAALEAAGPGATLCLEPGVHVAGMELERSVRLVGLEGAGKTTLQGNGRGPVLAVEADDLTVTIEGLTLSGGKSSAGGGVAIRGRGRVEVRDCIVAGNDAGQYGGGGLYAKAGTLSVRGTTFRKNTGNQGGAVLLDQAMKAEFEGCTFEDNTGSIGGAVRAREGIVATFAKCTFAGNRSDSRGSVVSMNGTTTRRPEVRLIDCAVKDGTFDNAGPNAGRLSIGKSGLPADAASLEGLSDEGGNVFGRRE